MAKLWCIVRHPLAYVRFVRFCISVVSAEMVRLALEDEQRRKFVADNGSEE